MTASVLMGKLWEAHLNCKSPQEDGLDRKTCFIFNQVWDSHMTAKSITWDRNFRGHMKRQLALLGWVYSLSWLNSRVLHLPAKVSWIGSHRKPHPEPVSPCLGEAPSHWVKELVWPLQPGLEELASQPHVSVLSSSFIAKHLYDHLIFFTLAIHLRNWKIEVWNRNVVEVFAPRFIYLFFAVVWNLAASDY